MQKERIYKWELTNYFQGYKCESSNHTSSVSQRGKKQGLACLPSDHFTSLVTVITWYKQEQKTCTVLDSREFQLY